MTNFLQLAWNWFNGNKTTIGLVVGFLLSKTWFTGFLGSELTEVLEWVSMTFIGIGVAHKVAKSNTLPEPNK